MSDAVQDQLAQMAEEAAVAVPMPLPGEVGPSRGLMQYIEGTFGSTLTNGPSVVQLLAEVMDDVRVVRKDGKNTAKGGGYNFRGIDHVVNAVGPSFRKHGVVATPKLLHMDSRDATVGANATRMQWVTVQVRYRFHGPAGDHIDAVVPGEAMDSGDKAASKAMSVAYRTALLQVLCIPTDEPDPDESTYQRSAPQEAAQPQQEAAPDLATEARARLLDTCQRLGVHPSLALTEFATMNNGADLRTTADHFAIDRLAGWFKNQHAAAPDQDERTE